MEHTQLGGKLFKKCAIGLAACMKEREVVGGEKQLMLLLENTI